MAARLPTRHIQIGTVTGRFMPSNMPVSNALPSFNANSRPIIRVNNASNAAHATMHSTMTMSARQPKK